ncbi:PadR family transcriptional regulator [Azospirillum griseum]|nr:helix-turn-helix transcriptional regulator [Azospirillum griseum]
MLGMEGDLLKGHLDAIVLAALAGEAAHGYAVIEAIRRRSGGVFNLPEGTVYPALHRLEKAGAVNSDWTTAPSGRRRRVYTLTPQGRAALDRHRDVWRAFAEAVERVMADAGDGGGNGGGVADQPPPAAGAP